MKTKKKTQKETHIKNKFVGSLVYMEKRVQGNDMVFFRVLLIIVQSRI